MKQILFTSLILATISHLESVCGQEINNGKFSTKTFTSSRDQGNLQVNYEAEFEKDWTPSFTSKSTQGLIDASFRQEEHSSGVPVFGSTPYEGVIYPEPMLESDKEKDDDNDSGSVWGVIFAVLIAFAVGFIAALVLFKYTNLVSV